MTRRNILYLSAALVVLIGVIISLATSKPEGRPAKNNQAGRLIDIPEPSYLFGIPVDSFKKEEIKVKKNEMLSNILLSRGINYARIVELAKRSKAVFDVRKIKAGNSFTFFWSLDSIPVVKHMVYEKNIEEYITYSFADSIQVTEGRKEVSYEQREIAGTIESSMWNSLVDLNVSPKLSLDLSDVYQWTIDFFGLQKGDSYRVIYEVKMIDETPIGINRVLASSFTHSGKEHWAFIFEQDGTMEYFDEEGQSLRRAFLKAPLKFSRISSGYSNSRLHPILKIYRPHRGIDYAASAGTPVHTIGDGKIVKIAYDKASGNYIKIKHNGVYTSGYMHLQRRPKFKMGQYVKQGDIIGNVGSTGYATGPHLDFRIWKNGQLVNPTKVESPPVEPVAAENKASFDSLASVFIMQLQDLGFDIKAYPNTPE